METPKPARLQKMLAQKILIPPLVHGMMTRLNRLAEVRVVGGAVRDQLLGLAIEETVAYHYDLAIKTTPPLLKKYVEEFDDWRLILDGFDHGIIRIVQQGIMVEVACLRRDVSTDGRHAVVAFGGDWQDDAARRDFTINALYADIAGQIFDPLGIMPDIKTPRLTFIGDSKQRITEDYLRILRYYRFLATIPLLSHDAADRKIIMGQKNGLQKISHERVGMELLKIFLSSKAKDTMRAMAEDGIWQEIGLRLKDTLIQNLSSAMIETINGWPATRRATFYFSLLEIMGEPLMQSNFAWPKEINKLIADHAHADKKWGSKFQPFAIHYYGGQEVYQTWLMHQWLKGNINQEQWAVLSQQPQPVFPLAKAGEELKSLGFGRDDFATHIPRLEKKWLDSQGQLSKAALLADIKK